MAIKDVKHYYYNMQAQYLEMKADLADFEAAFADGFITEDQLEEVKADVARIENNYDRLTYIMYLLEIPKRESKRAAHEKANKKLLGFFESANASEDQVKLENKSTLSHLRQELKRLSKVDND
jgi:hypothetical protein